jgi:hypothetical protein
MSIILGTIALDPYSGGIPFDLSKDSGYLDWDISWFFSVPLDKCRYGILIRVSRILFKYRPFHIHL